MFVSLLGIREKKKDKRPKRAVKNLLFQSRSIISLLRSLERNKENLPRKEKSLGSENLSSVSEYIKAAYTVAENISVA